MAPHFLVNLFVILFIGIIIALSIAGTIGFTRNVHDYLTRRKYNPLVIAGLSVVAAFVGFTFIWPFYVIWWPLHKLFHRRSKKLRIIGPIACLVIILIGLGIFLSANTVYLIFINDTHQQITIDGCTLDQTTMGSGKKMGLAVWKKHHACSIVQGNESSYGCLWLPAHMNSDMTIHLSSYTSLDKMQKSCE